MFPFSNNLYSFALSGEDLLEVLHFALTPEGSALLTFMSGITVYHTDDTIHAILRGDELLYDHGVWNPGRQ